MSFVTLLFGHFSNKQLKEDTSLKMEAYEKWKYLLILKDYIRHLCNINIESKFISQTTQKQNFTHISYFIRVLTDFKKLAFKLSRIILQAIISFL